MNQGKRKLAIVVPGIGYHTDKPLLYYGKKLAAADGFAVAEVKYGPMPDHVKDDPEKMESAFRIAVSAVLKVLRRENAAEYDTVVFLAKSVGTAAAAEAAKQMSLSAWYILYTPLAQTMSYSFRHAVAFHGTSDPWAETRDILHGCQKQDIPLFITEKANHSLETGDVMTDLQTLQGTMRETARFLNKAGGQTCLK